MLLIERTAHPPVNVRKTLYLALVYPVLIALGYVFKPTLFAAAALWPAEAAAFGAYLLLPYRVWPLIAVVTVGWELASVAVVAGVSAGWKPNLAIVLAFALANVVTAAVPAALLRSGPLLSGSPRFLVASLPRALTAVCLGSLPGAVLGALAQGALPGTSTHFADVGLWLLASVLAIVTYGPVLFDTVLTSSRADAGAARPWEKVAMPLLGAAALIAFARGRPSPTEPSLGPALLSIPLIWLALRFSFRDTRLGVVVVATLVAAICAHDTDALQTVAGSAGWRAAVLPIDVFLLIGCAGTLLINLLAVQQRELLQELEHEHRQLRLYAKALEAADETARRSVAADLHDGIGQVLAGQAMTIAAMKMYATNAGLEGLIRQASDASREAQSAVRLMVQDLSPPELENATTEQMLAWLASLLKTRYGFETRWRVNPGIDLPQHQVQLVYRCVRELLLNAFKHSQRNSAEVFVILNANTVVITVMDEGVGFDVDKVRETPGAHFGLMQVTERIQAAHGAVTIDSAPGEGCCTTIRLPLSRAAQPASVQVIAGSTTETVR